MANVAAAGTAWGTVGSDWNCPNYIGELYLIGANQTPFLNMIGGLQGGTAKTASDWQFAVAQPWALEAASQPAITETASLTAPTPVTYVRAQDTNVCQIFQRTISLSYALLSQRAKVAGLSLTGAPQPVVDEKSWQIEANLRQIAIDVEYSFLQGAYQLASGAGSAMKTRGIIAACTTNTTAASSAALSTTLINGLFQKMAASGAQFRNMVMFGNAFQVNKISALYGYQPMDRNIGGVAVKTFYTDFCTVQNVYCPQMPTGTVLFADISVCSPRYLEVPGKGLLFYEELQKTGAAEKGQLYGQIGLDYGPEEYHGTLTGLATS